MTTKLNYGNATTKEDLRRLQKNNQLGSYGHVDPIVVTTNVLVVILKENFGSELFNSYLIEDVTAVESCILHEECMDFLITFGLHNVATREERSMACSIFLKMRTSNNPRYF